MNRCARLPSIDQLGQPTIHQWKANVCVHVSAILLRSAAVATADDADAATAIIVYPINIYVVSILDVIIRCTFERQSPVDWQRDATHSHTQSHTNSVNTEHLTTWHHNNESFSFFISFRAASSECRKLIFEQSHPLEQNSIDIYVLFRQFQ